MLQAQTQYRRNAARNTGGTQRYEDVLCAHACEKIFTADVGKWKSLGSSTSPEFSRHELISCVYDIRKSFEFCRGLCEDDICKSRDLNCFANVGKIEKLALGKLIKWKVLHCQLDRQNLSCYSLVFSIFVCFP